MIPSYLTKRTLLLLTGLTCLSFSSCNNISHVLVYQHSNVGFCSGLNPQTNNVHVRLGIRQEVAALIPKVDHNLTDDPKATDPDAASTYIAMRVNVDNPFATPEVNELIATGQAAVNIASDKEPMKPFKEKNEN
jgi:hypothetical protein